MKILQIFVIVCTMISSTAFLTGCVKKVPNDEGTEGPVYIGKLTLKGEDLVVTEARSLKQQERGLSGQTKIGNDGMLFIFSRPGTPSFWMKDMLFDLDFIWIRDGKVVDVTTQVPKPSVGMTESSLPIYKPKTPADMMLEVPAGFVERKKIVIGDEANLN